MNAGEAALLSWQVEFLPAAAIIASGLVYVRGWRKLHRQVPGRFPVWRAACFLGGLAAVAVALMSPLDAFAGFLLISHMAQHLLLTMVAPPLIWLGAPQLPLLTGLPRAFVSRVMAPYFHWPPLVTLLHGLMHPALAWVAFVLSNVIWHVPAFYDLALQSPFWHEIEHGMFLGTALLFWWHVVQPWPSRPVWPRWAMVPYLLLADLQNTALSAFLSFSGGVLYPTYLAAPRVLGISPEDDQAGAGAFMWVVGSLAFLLPAGAIAIQLLSPKRHHQPLSPAPKSKARPTDFRPFDLLASPRWGKLIGSLAFRRTCQTGMLIIAALVVWDGLCGPQVSGMNAAGVLPWTHWRTLTVVALLVAGNLFCFACPFTWVRDLGRRWLPASWAWPRWLRGKWLAVGLIVAYLVAYEVFDLWDRPAVTALIIAGYFLAALLIDGFFRGAAFCQSVCPIGQFHFVQSLLSPLEVKVRKPDVCLTCRTHDCLRGNESSRGCELHLFQPRKQGNMDCTFCLDCVRACPHDNVGLLAVVPGQDILRDIKRSTVGRYARRPDIAALVLVLTFGAFANAAGMVTPVMNAMDRVVAGWGLAGDLLPVTIALIFALVVLPGGTTLAAARISGGANWRENWCRFSVAMAPLGFGMWLAHFLFHFITAALTPVPVFQRIANEAGWTQNSPDWSLQGFAFPGLPALEIVFLNAGFLACLYLFWKLGGQLQPARKWPAFLSWAAVATALYLTGIWIIFQPMEMRGTLLH